LPIAIDHGSDAAAWMATPALADRFGLTAYDAAYLELAYRVGSVAGDERSRLPAAGALAIELVDDGG
jgi:hypothetical protein